MGEAELRRAFARAIESIKRSVTYRGLLGDGDGELDVTLDDGSVVPDTVWVRVTFDEEESARTVVAARCIGVAKRYGLPVLLQRGIDGLLEVVGVDPSVKDEWSINAGDPVSTVAEHAWQHGRLGPDPLYIEGQQILPFSVQPTNPYSMSVDVWGGHYVYEGTQKVLTKTSVDLSSYKPTYGYKFVIVCLNPSTNTTSVVEGTTKAFETWPPPQDGDPTIAFSDAEVSAVSVSSPLLRLAAVQLHSNMTKVRPADIFVDLRPVALPLGAGGGGGGGIVAGEGLTLTGDVLDVNDDDVTLTIISDVLQVKDGGITPEKLSSSVAGDGLTGGAGSPLSVGAGTGISVSSDSVSINTSVVPRKYSTTVGDGTSTSFLITHNLGTQAVSVTLVDLTNAREVFAQVGNVLTNSITVSFNDAPASGQILVLVVG
ncbi:MAG: hypothetical protein QXS68_03085 [Candidatus Methanomethylicaceae archaeon]